MIRILFFFCMFFLNSKFLVFAEDYPRNYLKEKIQKYPSPSCAELLIYNLTEMYKDRNLIQYIVENFSEKTRTLNPDFIAAPEARALPIFGALTYNLNLPGLFIRKKGKLPVNAPKISLSYHTAYSNDSIEITIDENLKGKTVIIVDDGISSGGTTLATIQLLQQAGMKVLAIFAVVQHHYREKVPEYEPWSAVTHTLFDL